MSWTALRLLGRVVFATIVAVVLVSVGQRCGSLLKDVVAEWEWLPRWLSSAASWCGRLPPPMLNVQAIVAAALAVTGTLAGVYFATVAFVVSTAYKDTTARVRALVTRLPGGRVYARVYVQAVLSGLIVLMMPTVGRQPNHLVLAMVALLGGFVVLSFGRLRTQLYDLLEPRRLLPIVGQDLARSTMPVSRPGSGEPDTQVLLRRRQTLASLQTLSDICALVRSREKDLTNVAAEYVTADTRSRTAAQYLSSQWLTYGRRKRDLLATPGWCVSSHEHKDWLLADAMEIGVALSTSTTLPATRTEDSLWVERRLAAILGELLSGRGVAELASLLNALDDPVRELMRCGLFAEARLWIETVAAPVIAEVERALPAPVPRATVGTDAATGGELSSPATGTELALANVVDFVMHTHIQAVLGLYDHVAALTADFPQWALRQVAGKRVRNLGPVAAQSSCQIQDALDFEVSIEGRRITSDANVSQLMARAIATEIIDEATQLMAVFDEDLWPWVRRVGDSPTAAAGAALSRMDEATAKWQHPLAAMAELFTHCEAAHRETDDAWPDLDLDDLHRRRQLLHDGLRTPIAVLAARANAHPRSDRPDMFGWAFQRSYQDLFDDVLSDRAVIDLDQRLLALFMATDSARVRLQSSVRRHHPSVLAAVWSEPLSMLLQLSGTAMTIGVVNEHDKLRLAGFDTAWERVLDANAQHVLDLCLETIVHNQRVLGMSPGLLAQTTRHNRVVEALQARGFRREDLYFGEADLLGGESNPRAALILSRLQIAQLSELFVAAWLLPRSVQRGAVPTLDHIGSRLAALIAAFEALDATQSTHHGETGAADPAVEQ
ncbi:hypothetical protein ACFV4K_24595 [Nocardia sp. NPDC059764]|uniref:hypothetical protein n=1 Tax=Nocardia sp. NPDC059764 TaxID=3346939 RepID=UPI0036520845